MTNQFDRLIVSVTTIVIKVISDDMDFFCFFLNVLNCTFLVQKPRRALSGKVRKSLFQQWLDMASKIHAKT
jgi:hypothetical protein